MKLEFSMCKITDLSQNMKQFIKVNEFIIVGEECIENEDYYMMHSLNSEGLKLINGLDIQEFSYKFPKDKVEIDKTTSVTLDIPKKFLTLDIIDEIQKLNS